MKSDIFENRNFARHWFLLKNFEQIVLSLAFMIFPNSSRETRENEERERGTFRFPRIIIQFYYSRTFISGKRSSERYLADNFAFRTVVALCVKRDSKMLWSFIMFLRGTRWFSCHNYLASRFFRCYVNTIFTWFLTDFHRRFFADIRTLMPNSKSLVSEQMANSSQ